VRGEQGAKRRAYSNNASDENRASLVFCTMRAQYLNPLVWRFVSLIAELKPYKGIEHVVFPAKVPSHRIVHVPGFFNDEHIEGVLRLGERVKKMEEGEIGQGAKDRSDNNISL